MPAITAEDMRKRLIPLDTARERLASTEPLSEITFDTDSSAKVKFKLEPAWNAGIEAKPGTEIVDATINVNGVTYKLTKDAILETTSLVGLPRNFVMRTPGPLVQPLLEYHYRNGEAARKLLATGDVAHALTKATIRPFSNLGILQRILDAIQAKYGTDNVLVDYKFHHDLRATRMRVIVPERQRAIKARTGTDNWSLGIQFRNSLVGDTPLSLSGYLFNWSCTNGQISQHATSGNYNRRQMGQGEDEVMEWARTSVDEIFAELDPELDLVDAMTSIPIDGEVNEVLANVFSDYKVPLAARDHIIKEMVEQDDLTAYGLMNAVTSAANHSEGLSFDGVENLMNIGGSLPHSMRVRCGECKRFVANH